MRGFSGLLLLQIAAPLAGPLPPTPGAEALSEEAVAARDDYLRTRDTQLFTLGGWGDANLVGTGLAFLVARSPFARAVELQALIWGIGNSAISIAGLLGAKGAQKNNSPPLIWEALRRQDRQRFFRSAAFEAGIALLGGALWLLARKPRWRGTGAGIVLQGSVLALLDLLTGLGLS